jgi:hypothetical protein
MNETEIPTPRTGSQLHYPHATGDGIINLVEGDFARQLERENAAMREIFPKVLDACQNGSGCLPEVSLWFLSSIPEEVRLVVDGLKQENAAMREVIKEAEHALDILMIAKRGGMQPANALIDAMFYAADTRKKLKPYLP